MKRTGYALILALAFGGAALAATQPPDAVRAPIQAEIDEVMAPDPEEPNAPPVPKAGPRMFKRVNINNDGVADWWVDFEEAPNPSYFCGTGGCRQRIYVSNPQGGYDLAMDRTARLFKLRRSRGQTLLDLDFHGSACSGFGVDDCPRNFVWSAARARFVIRLTPRGETFFIGGPTQLMTPPFASLPPPVQAAFAERTALCKAAGRTNPYEDAYLTEVDDLNADGRPDWVIGGAYDGCAYSEGTGEAPKFDLTVLVSGPTGYRLALRSDVTTWGLDLAGGKATFVTLEGADDCGLNGKDCRKIRWRWTGEALSREAAP